MVINDKLKGEYYRAPITKLASRNNILTTLNELIDYFNKIYQLLDTNFTKITGVRREMKQNLVTIYEKTMHFKYVLDHFHLDIDTHIKEKLDDAIENFQDRMESFVTTYDTNLFNHSSITDEIISSSSNPNSVEEWDRSVNILASTLGIRWFGGKITDRSLISQLNNILRITKVNTYDGFTNEDYINSNLILEIFLYTPKGMTWLSLGKNGDFGFNIITKYQSESSRVNLKVASESYNTRRSFDINTFDFDMILDALLDRTDIKDGNVYIKVKTNIPSNTESGKEGYFLSSSDKFDNHEVKKSISEFSRGLMYHDNKDVAYFEHKNDNIFDVNQKYSDKIETPYIINAKTDEIKDFGTTSKENIYYADISSTPENTFSQTVYNPIMEKMSDLMDVVSGYVVTNSASKTTKEYFDNMKFNEKYIEGDKINYTKGENLVDISDETFVGDLALLPKNENMFAIENTFSKTKVIPSNIKYGSELKNTIIENCFSNDDSFVNMSNTKYNQNADIVLTPIVERNSLVYKVLKVNDEDTIIIKSDGIYRFNSKTNISTNNTYTQQLSTNGLFNVCYDALLNGNYVYLATDLGICRMSTSSFIIERTGVVGAAWCKLFETIDKKHIIGIRKDFATSLDNGRISYGDSIAITNNGSFNLIRVAFNDKSYYSYDNPVLDDELTNTDYAIDYTNKRHFQNEFKVIPSEMENKYYFFRYGHKMLVTDAADDTVLSFKNFKVVEAMKNYAIADALMFDNKIYFTVYNGGNFVYDLSTNTVSEVQYTDNKIINNRNTTIKHYYMSKLTNLVGNNADSTGIVDKYVLLTEDEIRAGYVPGTKYFYPSIKNIHLVSVEERLAGPDPNIDYYGCIGNKMSVIGSWFIGKLNSFDNVSFDGTTNPDMNYGYLEFENDGTYLDYTLAVSVEGFRMDHSKIYKQIHVEEELPKENCFLKVANGKLFFIPNNEDNEITNLIYINGFYYFATNQNFIYKLDDNFHVVSTIRSEDCNELVGDGDLLVIQNNKTISEEVTRSEIYYDRVDGSETIIGFNPDIPYYIEKDVTETTNSYRTLTDEEYEAGAQVATTAYFKKISDEEYQPYSSGELYNRRINATKIETYPITSDMIDPSKTYGTYNSNDDDYNVYDTASLLDPNMFNLETFFNADTMPLYEITGYTDAFIPPKEEIYVEGQVSTTTKQMVEAEINDENFILTPVYTPLDSEEKQELPDENTDYYVTRDLPDITHYDHIEPEAKTRDYDSTLFNVNEYFLGELIDFSTIPEEEKDGKRLYVANDEGNNYIYVDTYREGVTVLNPTTDYYTESGVYNALTDMDFNHGFEFATIDTALDPVPEQGVQYYYRTETPDPDTGLPVADAGIGGETLLAWDPDKEYLIPWKMYYKFKNDNTFGYQKTYFHKRIEDGGVEYVKATNSDFKRVDTYHKLGPDELAEEPDVDITYYTHPLNKMVEFNKVIDKSTGKLADVDYVKINDVTPLYTQLTTQELNAGPIQGKVYYIYDGGVYIEKTRDTLVDNVFASGVTYYRLVGDTKADYWTTVGVTECTTSDFDGRIRPIDKAQFSDTITDELITKIYVNPLPSEAIQYIEDSENITQIVGSTSTDYERIYGHEIYKLIDDQYVRVESGDMVSGSGGGFYLNPDYTWYRKETIPLEEYRLSTREDFDYTGDFENVTFKSDRDYWIYRDDLPEYSFKDNVTYYVRNYYDVEDESRYVETRNFEPTTILESSNRNIIKTHDVYLGDNTDVLFAFDNVTKNISKYVNKNFNTSFTLTGNTTANKLLYSNGKLFVFDDGTIYDWLQDEHATWRPISINNEIGELDEAKMIGNNLVLFKEIQDGVDINKWKVYFYDYSTRSIVESTDIGVCATKPEFINYEDGIVVEGTTQDGFVNDGNRNNTDDVLIYANNKTWIFNRNFTEVENSLGEFTSSSKFDLDTDDTDTTTSSFIELSDTRATKYVSFLNKNGEIFVETSTGMDGYYRDNTGKLTKVSHKQSIGNIGTYVMIVHDSTNGYFLPELDTTNGNYIFTIIDDEDASTTKTVALDNDYDYSSIHILDYIGNSDNLNVFVKRNRKTSSSDNTCESFRIVISDLLGDATDLTILNQQPFTIDTDGNLDADDVWISDRTVMIVDSLDNGSKAVRYYYEEASPSSIVFDTITIDDVVDVITNEDSIDKTIFSCIHTIDNKAIASTWVLNDAYNNDEYKPTSMNIGEESVEDSITMNGIGEEVIYITNSGIIINNLKFDTSSDYYTLTTHYEFEDDKDYYLKSINVSFKLDHVYYTKKTRITVLDVINSARSYTSTDNASKLYHQSLFKVKENSLKVLMNVLSN